MESIHGVLKHYKPAIRRILVASRLGRPLRSVRLFVLRRMYGERYHEAVFTKIWKKNSWGDTDSNSGSGSNLLQTALIRHELVDLLDNLRVYRFLDIPCGDFYWMKEVRFRPGLTYLGGDIVEAVVRKNNDRYGRDTVSFVKLNVLLDELPKVDLVMCRDCLVHFSSSDVSKALRNFKRSGSTYLLVTHFEGDRENRDILTGEWRSINFTKQPFNFPPPLHVINEGCTEFGQKYRDKCLALWRLEDIPDMNLPNAG
jgi:SAM-dependent methyltransferase